jgi:hypothetical protein
MNVKLFMRTRQAESKNLTGKSALDVICRLLIYVHVTYSVKSCFCSFYENEYYRQELISTFNKII